jgi:hypothetical protein
MIYKLPNSKHINAQTREIRAVVREIGSAATSIWSIVRIALMPERGERMEGACKR